MDDINKSFLSLQQSLHLLKETVFGDKDAVIFLIVALVIYLLVTHYKKQKSDKKEGR